jgi:non-specific serine/threonine protein kinase
LNAERVLCVSGDNAPDVVVTHGEWLKSVLETLSHPEKLEIAETGSNFHALLRPYQQKGLSWLEGMRRLGLVACLADDMGLGKTVQAIALLNGIRDRSLKTGDGHRTLLVVPASLVGNWTSELDRFAPGIRYHVLHGTLGDKLLPAGPGELPGSQAPESGIRQPDLVITTYGMVTRMKALRETVWDIVILDEAQAIRNPGTLQTRAVKQLQARYRVAMTGTPVENRLSDLWSLFDFLNKGLLGSATEFRTFAAKLERDRSGYVRLKQAVSPFILRRLKTDRAIIGDLPDKVEMKTFAMLTRKQVLLYNQIVLDIQRRLVQADEGMERRGLILAAMMRFKQICNHPDQYLGQQAYEEADSGKMERLRDIGELVRDKRERMLVFTQFREITEPLSRFLAGVFGSGGLVLHGGTPVKERKKLVDRFQGDDYVPFMVLSIKAGGVGLNLTAANHVVHFDRWWNPAVENQATDRAFRIGQQKNVMVHKFITKGTLEEKIDRMIEDKLRLAGDILPETQEQWLTELDNGRLMDLFRLDMRE